MVLTVLAVDPEPEPDSGSDSASEAEVPEAGAESASTVALKTAVRLPKTEVMVVTTGVPLLKGVLVYRIIISGCRWTNSTSKTDF